MHEGHESSIDAKPSVTPEQSGEVVVVTRHANAPTKVGQGLGMPFRQHSIEDESGEPLDSKHAALWKIMHATGPLVYASDVTNFFGPERQATGKPDRYIDGEAIKTEDEYIEKVLIPRYTEKGGVLAGWNVVFGLQLPNESIRLCDIQITADVPEMTPDEVRKYYTPDSSAGIELMSYLKDKREQDGIKTNFLIRGKDDRVIATITPELAWDLIIHKVPPARYLRWLRARLLLESEDPAWHDVRGLGIYTFGVFELLDQSKDNFVQVDLADGSMGYATWVQDGDYEARHDYEEVDFGYDTEGNETQVPREPKHMRNDLKEVSQLLKENFRQSEVGSRLMGDERASVESDFDMDAVKKLTSHPDVMGAYAIRNEKGELLAYMSLINGKRRDWDNQYALNIAQMAIKPGQDKVTKQTMITLAERVAQDYGLATITYGDLLAESQVAELEALGFEALDPINTHKPEVPIFLQKKLGVSHAPDWRESTSVAPDHEPVLQ